MLEDTDRRPFAPMPASYASPFAWDAANQTIFRPISRFFAVDPAGPAVNVNALDEVPNSSWFVNRIGVRPMTPAEVVRGSCDDKVLDPDAPDGSWLIDHGKDNGANPGFRVNIPGLGKFMLKTDPKEEPERATGATAISARVYHAAGYFAPCDVVVYFRPSLLKLKPGLQITNNQGVTKPFDERALEAILSSASHSDGLVRMVAAGWEGRRRLRQSFCARSRGHAGRLQPSSAPSACDSPRKARRPRLLRGVQWPVCAPRGRPGTPE